MSAIITLPASLRARLTALRWRIRLLRAVGGFALLVVGVGVLAAAAVLADYWLDLPAQTRQIVFLTWLAVAGVWLLRGVIVPFCCRIDATALAAVIEEKHPDLGERLSSTVELAGATAEGHGSPLLIALLLEETAAQSKPLDFLSVVPSLRATLLTTLATATLLLIAAPALFWPQQYGEWAQRFFRPWDVIAPVEAPADIAVLPSVPPITPVELAADSPTITVTPPAYARSVKQTETLHGLVDVAPLQHSEVRFDFRFTRPAVAAYLEEVREETTRHSLTLSADRQAASLTIPALIDGKYRLILEAEQDVRTDLAGGAIHVQLDQPPSVRRFTGKEYLRSVLPYERIPFEIEAADDIGVASIELEYRVNDGEPIRQPLQMEGGNTPSALARHVLGLAGKVNEEDRFSYRFHIRDNLPKEYKGPHVIVYPPDRWLTLRIARRGESLQEQEILATRDEINRRLQAIRESLLREKQAVSQVQQEALRQASLPPDRLDRIQQLQRDNRSNQKALREMAQLAEASTNETPVSPLQPVAELAREVADQEMYKSQQALDHAPQQEAPAAQARQLKTADQQLGSAVKRLEELKKMSDRLVQERLDRIKLEMLAEREKHLAEKTADLAGKHPVLDPKAREQTEKIKGEQAQVAGELEQLAQRNEPLKQARQQAQAEQAQQLAQWALELAKSQRDLTQAQAETERKRTAQRFAELARKQQQLAKQQEELAQQAPSAPAQAPPLNPENGRHAAEDLQQGKAPEAIRHQEQAANELTRLAQAFDKAAKAADPNKESARSQRLQGQSEQARQLADRQRELRDAVQRASQKPGNDKPVVSEDPIEELTRKQKEVAKLLTKLGRTISKDQGEDASLTQQAHQASRTAKEAARQMQTGTLALARQAGEKTAEQLNRLGAELAKTPSRDHWQGFDPDLLPHQLRRRQLEINRRLQQLEGNTRALLAHQRTQQRYLQEEATELSQQLQSLAKEARSSRVMQSALQRATANSQQAQQAMQQAREQGQRDEAPAEKQSQERAAQLLEQAAKAASEAARSNTVRANEEPTLRSERSQAGEAAVKAGQQMAQAQGQLNRGQAAQAQAAMQQAARELAQAAQHMAALPALPQRQQGTPGQQTAQGRQAGGLPDLSAYGVDKAAYAGKSWGELPGELRTKIVQDIQARYGEDYARMIKSYFEQIADTKKK